MNQTTCRLSRIAATNKFRIRNPVIITNEMKKTGAVNLFQVLVDIAVYMTSSQPDTHL